MGKKIVIALGGNALGNTPKEQYEAVKVTASSIVDLVQEGHTVVVGHGNGPQVGMISLAFGNAQKVDEKTPEMPLALSVAMSQGYIGLHLQQAIKNELVSRGITNKEAVSIVSQTIVNQSDPAFANPTKPIGSFYTEEEAKKLAKINGWVVKEDSGRGWRRVVPSPLPTGIVEKDTILELVKKGDVVIAGGGGGIPTLVNGKVLESVDAVIDKDFTSELMAEIVGADLFMIVTAEDGIWIDYNKPGAHKLDSIKTTELKKLIDSDHFPAGSMKPKVMAVYNFVNNTKKDAIITSLELTKDALKGKAGTKVLF